jgi:hypothetical protein
MSQLRKNMKLIVFHTVWMKHYAGLIGDAPRGFSKAPGLGEVLNFSPINGRMFGYVQAYSIDLYRIDKTYDGGGYVDNVTVAWTATRPEGGRFVVGVYYNARVYDSYQHFDKPRLESEYGVVDAYYTMTSREDYVFIPESNRTFEVPARVKGMPGTSAVWYADSPRPEVRAFVDKLRVYVEKLRTATPRPGNELQPARDLRARPLDPSVRREIEIAAIKAFNAFAKQRFSDKIIRDAQKDNLGWDAEVYPSNSQSVDETTASGADFLIEIKGNAGSSSDVTLSPSEYEMAKLHWQKYRLFIVNDALTSPRAIFLTPVSPDCKRWRDEDGTELKLEEATSARVR